MTEREPMSNNTNTSLADAIAAARAGRRDEATRMLRQLVSADPFNVDAWVWLGGIATEPHEQRSALEHAVSIAPHNQRAQQGLAWLRQSQPELFSETTATATDRTTTSRGNDEHGAAIYQVPDQPQPRLNEAATQAFATPAQPQPRLNEAATQVYAVPARSQPEPTYAQSQVAAQPSRTDRMSTLPSTSYQEPARATQYDSVGYTDRMAVAPPPPAVAASEPAERYDSHGNISRWLLLLIWLFSFGAVATVAALIIIDPTRFESLVQPLLAQFGLRLIPADIQTTAFVTSIVLIAVAVIDAMVILGMLLRGRWSWVINLLVALLVTAGTVALAVTYFTLVPSLLTSGVQLALGVLGAFTLIYLILSFTSRRAFFRRPVQHSYGG